ncbi:tyrosine-type recombinase/integrase [Sulfurimonas sp.]|uniref:tyrosine-type recombinase/integrase n=1 Tax=Sulfurimonas sp. TaxID=2022749 RepID=UPI003566BB4A
MKKLRFKNRNGVLYFGFDGKFKSSKLKDTNVNRNIIKGKFLRGELNSDLSINEHKSPLIKDLVKEVFIDKSKHLKRKTLKAYATAKDKHILPYFGDKMVTDIKPIDIKNFQDDLVAKGLNSSSIRFPRVILKEAFNLAILSEHIISNPIVMVGVPKIKKKEQKPKPFTLDEIDLILSSAAGPLRNFLGISFFTGMRSGELLALKWEDVDFETETITINKTIADGAINSAKTKSSERDIEMIPQVIEFFKAQQLVTFLNGSYVFLNARNNHYGNNMTMYSKYQDLLKKLKLEKRSLHNTRHTFASIMLNNGIDPLWVSNTLGHSNLQITLKIYTHYMPKKEKMKLPFLEKRYKTGTLSL